jgi:hypothetical protein
MFSGHGSRRAESVKFNKLCNENFDLKFNKSFLRRALRGLEIFVGIPAIFFESKLKER